eukprot:jgi/Mesvir1/15043/Mv14696-RA.1
MPASSSGVAMLEPTVGFSAVPYGLGFADDAVGGCSQLIGPPTSLAGSALLAAFSTGVATKREHAIPPLGLEAATTEAEGAEDMAACMLASVAGFGGDPSALDLVEEDADAQAVMNSDSGWTSQEEASYKEDAPFAISNLKSLHAGVDKTTMGVEPGGLAPAKGFKRQREEEGEEPTSARTGDFPSFEPLAEGTNEMPQQEGEEPEGGGEDAGEGFRTPTQPPYKRAMDRATSDAYLAMQHAVGSPSQEPPPQLVSVTLQATPPPQGMAADMTPMGVGTTPQHAAAGGGRGETSLTTTPQGLSGMGSQVGVEAGAGALPRQTQTHLISAHSHGPLGGGSSTSALTVSPTPPVTPNPRDVMATSSGIPMPTPQRTRAGSVPFSPRSPPAGQWSLTDAGAYNYLPTIGSAAWGSIYGSGGGSVGGVGVGSTGVAPGEAMPIILPSKVVHMPAGGESYPLRRPDGSMVAAEGTRFDFQGGEGSGHELSQGGMSGGGGGGGGHTLLQQIIMDQGLGGGGWAPRRLSASWSVHSGATPGDLHDARGNLALSPRGRFAHPQAKHQGVGGSSKHGSLAPPQPSNATVAAFAMQMLIQGPAASKPDDGVGGDRMAGSMLGGGGLSSLDAGDVHAPHGHDSRSLSRGVGGLPSSHLYSSHLVAGDHHAMSQMVPTEQHMGGGAGGGHEEGGLAAGAGGGGAMGSMQLYFGTGGESDLVPSEHQPRPRSSRYRGVTRHRRSGRWEAYIWIPAEGKQMYLGGFESEERAAEAYDILAIKQKGGDAATNFSIREYSSMFSFIDQMETRDLMMEVRSNSQRTYRVRAEEEDDWQD